MGGTGGVGNKNKETHTFDSWTNERMQVPSTNTGQDIVQTD